MASGHEINFGKSEVSMSGNVSNERKVKLAGLLGLKLIDNHGKYLGMPTGVGRSKTRAFNFLKERVWKRLRG